MAVSGGPGRGRSDSIYQLSSEFALVSLILILMLVIGLDGLHESPVF